MRSTNLAVLTGTVCDAPESIMSGETLWASFQLVTRGKYPGTDGIRRPETDWHPIVATNDLARRFLELNRGDRVLVEGRIQAGRCRGADGSQTDIFQILASRIELLRLRDPSEYPETPAKPTDPPPLQDF